MIPLHVDHSLSQCPKHPGAPCGDVVLIERSRHATLVVLADGLGHGSSANVAATFHAHRLVERVRRGSALRAAFASLVETLVRAKTTGLPFSTLTVVRIRNHGETQIFSYEAPAPLLVSPGWVTPLEGRAQSLAGDIFREAHCVLDEEDALMLTSDGITQAGMGPGRPFGWTSEGVAQQIDSWRAEGLPRQEFAAKVFEEARDRWGARLGDDCTALLLSVRPAEQVTLMTGPPLKESEDKGVVQRFQRSPGKKIICGASTAKMVARELGERLQVAQKSGSHLTPPSYLIRGVDLVTEGVVTLNQALHLLDTDPRRLTPGEGVTELVDALMSADRILLLAGRAPNLAEGDITFLQLGVLHRVRIVELLSEALRERGKLVMVEWG